jgi:F1F0 ATPase subunit 2
MIPTDIFRPVIALVCGGLLGGAYFGGLYLTVKRLGRSSSPRLLLTVSFAIRLAVVLVAFYLLSYWGVLSMMSGMAGFIAARVVWLRSRYGRG